MGPRQNHGNINISRRGSNAGTEGTTARKWSKIKSIVQNPGRKVSKRDQWPTVSNTRYVD